MRITKSNNSHRIGPSKPLLFISICLVDINVFAVVFARFDEIPTMTVQVIQETKRPKGRKGKRDGQPENSIPKTQFVGGIKSFITWKPVIVKPL